MKIEELKNKVKIILEYPLKLIGFTVLSKRDLDKLNIKIWLKDGKVIYRESIESMSFSVRKELKKEQGK